MSEYTGAPVVTPVHLRYRLLRGLRWTENPLPHLRKFNDIMRKAGRGQGGAKVCLTEGRGGTLGVVPKLCPRQSKTTQLYPK